MMIALSESEIASFLECPNGRLQSLWTQNTLGRTVFADGRHHPELSHSSVFDVLEYYLRQDVMPDADPSDVEIWLTAIDEFVEQEYWQNRPFEDMVLMLMEVYADFSGKPLDLDVLARRATMILSAYFALLNFVDPSTVKN